MSTSDTKQNTIMASDQLKGTEPQATWNQTGLASGDQRQISIPVLTEEEQLVMKECDRDSFFQRALPLSLGCMFGAQMMVRSGRWKPHPKLGSLPKVIIFGSVGYLMGRISYVPVCQQKILNKIPNSNLAIAIRKAKGLPEHENLTPTWNDGAGNAPSSRIKDDYSALEGLDDRFRPTLDRDVKDLETPSQEKGAISYEELRRRNRQEYESQTSKSHPKTPGSPSYKDTPLMPQKPWPDAKSGDTDSSLGSPSTPPPPQAPPARKRTNMWGDPIDE